MKEGAVKSLIRNYVAQLLPMKVIANPAGPASEKGRPDMCLHMGPYCMYIETKGSSGELEEHQVNWIKAHAERHIPCVTADGSKGVVYLCPWNEPKRAFILKRDTPKRNFVRWIRGVFATNARRLRTSDLRRFLSS